MLVLSRKTDEVTLLILPNGTHVKVLVVAVKGDRVRLGFEASDEVRIIRKELLNRMPAALGELIDGPIAAPAPATTA